MAKLNSEQVTQPQSYQAFPLLNTPIIDSVGETAQPWYRTFIGFFNRLGGSQSSYAGATYTQADSAGQLSYLCSTNKALAWGTLAELSPGLAAGARAFITDATAGPSFAAAAIGGGTLFAPVYWDGEIWRFG